MNEFQTMLITEPAPGNSIELEAQRSLIDKIADIAHCGGLAGLSESESLIAIRKLTINYWRKDRTVSQMKLDVALAMRVGEATFKSATNGSRG